MVCKACGNPLKKDDQFCPNCNHPVNGGGKTVLNKEFKNQSRRINKIIFILIPILIVIAFFLGKDFLFNNKEKEPEFSKEAHILQAEVKPNEAKEVGDLNQEGWSLSFEEETFNQNTHLLIDISTAEESKTRYPIDDAQIQGGLMDVKVFDEDGDIVFLEKEVTISMNLGKKVEPQEMINYMVGCYEDGVWHLVHPDQTDLADGIITFKTNHFTPYAAVKLNQTALVKKMALEYAEREWIMGNGKEQLMKRLQYAFKDAFNEAGIEEKDHEKLLLRIKLHPDFEDIVDRLESGEEVDLATECADLSTDAILTSYTSFPGSSVLTYGGMLPNFVVGTNQLWKGDYKDAATNYGKIFLNYFPPTSILLSTLEGIQLAENIYHDWNRFSSNVSFEAYKNYIGADGEYVDLDDAEWKKVIQATYGNEDRAMEAAISEFAYEEGLTIAEVKEKYNIYEIYYDFSQELLNDHKERYIRYIELKDGVGEYEKIITNLIQGGFLEPGSFRFQIGDSVEKRLDDLLTKRRYILNLFGGTMPTLQIGESAEGNLQEALLKLIQLDNKTPEFMEWLAEKGYIKKQIIDTNENELENDDSSVKSDEISKLYYYDESASFDYLKEDKEKGGYYNQERYALYDAGNVSISDSGSFSIASSAPGFTYILEDKDLPEKHVVSDMSVNLSGQIDLKALKEAIKSGKMEKITIGEGEYSQQVNIYQKTTATWTDNTFIHDYVEEAKAKMIIKYNPYDNIIEITPEEEDFYYTRKGTDTENNEYGTSVIPIDEKRKALYIIFRFKFE